MKTCLYFTYDGLLDPLGQSQILPYILNLNNKGYKFIIISYEKYSKNEKIFISLSKKLRENGIQWKPLRFRKWKFHFFVRIILGIFFTKLITFRNKINLVHLRGGFSGLIYFFSFSRINYLYDLRAFWGQWADGGRTKYGSLIYKLLIKLEKNLIKKASGIIVLDKSGEIYIRKNFDLKVPLFIIPTSTNIKKYEIQNRFSKDKLKFVYLGGGKYPPYRIKDAVLFIKYLIEKNINCEIDFINKNDREIINNIALENNLPKKNYSIFSIDHEKIFKVLPKYDIGLIFLDLGEWIRMSSPTKIGEYLASGLIVIGNKGIAVLDRLANESNCVEIIEIKPNINFYDESKIRNLCRKVKNPSLRNHARELAEKYYSLEKANKNYESIYKLLLNH